MKDDFAIRVSIDFIESRLTEAICVSELAQQTFFSKTHYQRLFRAIVGEPVMAYVKNRRLQLACRDVLAGSAGILDIALKYGYDSHEGFTRAFKAYFGTAPSDYRKHVKQNETEAVEMLSSGVLNRIGQNAEKVYAALSNFIEEAEKLAVLANKTASTAGLKGVSTAIVANELNGLAGRMGHLRDGNVKNLAANDMSAFEMFGKIYDLIRSLDDGVFQMNLLRFFCGIETGRISPPKDEFDMIDAGYAKLSGKIVDNKEHMIALMNEAIELIHEDINQEAAGCIESSVKELGKAAGEGENTASSAYAATESLGEHGNAFLHIANEVSASVSELKSVTEDFNKISDIPASLSRLGNTAFGMNINAFNAAVEAARVGNPTECLTAAEKIMKYAGVLQKAYLECAALYTEYQHLTELAKRNAKQCEQEIAEKRLDDIIFQSRILSMQFALEAERDNCGTLRDLAQTAVAAHKQLVKTRNVPECRKAVAKFLKELNALASAPDIGGSFAYFAKEYEYFLKRSNTE